MSIKQDILWRILIAFTLVCLMAVAIVVQTIRIQTLQKDYWFNLADSLTTKYKTIEAERGNIYSEDGSLLATSIPFYEIRMDLNSTAMEEEVFNKNVDSLAIYLSEFFKDKTAREYRNKLISARRNGSRYLLISRKVTFPDLQKIKKFPLFRLGKYKGGFITIQKSKRITPFKLLAHRSIGYIREGIMPIGLEGTYDLDLSGVEGKQLMQRIASNLWIPINDTYEIEPENGKDVVTTLDTYIQDVTESALLKALVLHDADHGCAIVMEVSTGKIKAIANLGRTAPGQYWEIYNYAIGESTEPGSTFKLASIIAALEDNFVTLEDSVYIKNGSKQYYDEWMKDSNLGFTGWMSVKQAFEISSNVGISQIIYDHYKDDPNRFIRRLEQMNLRERTGIDIAGEPDPFIKQPNSHDWSGTTLPWMSVGYELTITPLQMLSLYNAVANDGEMMAPYLVNEIQEFGKPLQVFQPRTLVKKICSKKTIQQVQILLEGVVENGTASAIKSQQYKIAGKTGTAKIVEKKQGYTKIYQASFAGYFPADDPKYSCIVVVNSPSAGSYYGSKVAAPVFKEIADKIYARKIGFDENSPMFTESPDYENHIFLPNMKSGHGDDINIVYEYFDIPYSENEEAVWVSTSVNQEKVILKTIELAEGYVPDVVGMGLQDGLYLLENSGLKVNIKGKGKIQRQSIASGTLVYPGTQITIELI
ncbi:MAG: transpeptidase family protein [Bacteroidetes bacterium]|nr:transpeptidase family protein [Bacteroidota bacterium]